MNSFRVHVVPVILGSTQISSSTVEESSEAPKWMECSNQESTEIPFEESLVTGDMGVPTGVISSQVR